MQNDRFTLGQDGRTGVYMNGQDLSAKHLIHWLEVDSKETRTTIYQATTIANYFTIAQRSSSVSNNVFGKTGPSCKICSIHVFPRLARCVTPSLR